MSTAADLPLPGFEAEAPAPSPSAAPAPSVELCGTLSAPAEVRCKPIGPQGQVRPVLCLHLDHVGPGNHTAYAEQVYTEATRKLAEETAARLRKGTAVRVRGPLHALRVSIPYVEHLQVLETPA